MRRLVIAAAAAALAGASLVLLPATAHAAIVDAGPLAPGVETTVTLNAADLTTFDLVIPPGARPTLTVSALSAGAFVQATQAQLFTGAFGNFVGDDPTTWYADLAPNTSDVPFADTLQVQAFSDNTTMTFTLGYATDSSQTVTPGVATPVSIAHPGDRTLLTFDPGVQDTVTVHVSDVSLTASGPRDPAQPDYTVYYSFPFGDQPPLPETVPGSGDFQPLTLGGDGPLTLAVDPTFDRVGTLTVTVEVTPGTVGLLEYGQSATATFDRPNRSRRYGFTAQASAPTLVRAFVPQLTRPDGTPGSATVELTVAGSTVPVASGTITGDQTLLDLPAGTLPDGADAVLTVRADGTTTGILGLSVQFDPGPSTPLSLNQMTRISLPTGAQTSRYSLSATAGETIVLPLDAFSFSPLDGLPEVEIGIESPFGFVNDSPTRVTSFDTRLVTGFTATVTGTWTIVISRQFPGADTGFAFEADLLPLKQSLVRLDRTVPTDETVPFTDPAQVVKVTVPGTRGQVLVARLTEQTWTGSPDRFGNPPTSGLEFTSGAGTNLSESRSTASGDRYVESLPLEADGPVELTIAPTEIATGSVRLTVGVAQVSTGALAPEGTATTIPLAEPGGKARYTFEGTAGEPFALNVSALTLTGSQPDDSALVSLIGPDGPGPIFGSEVLRTPAWLDLPDTAPSSGIQVLPSTGTYVVEVDPHGDSTGSITVTRTRPRIITTPVRSGSTRTLTFGLGDVHRLSFDGRAGQRPVLRFTGQTVSTGIRLLDPTGRIAGTVFEQDDLRYQEFAPLPSAGRWTLELDPSRSGTGSLTARFDLVTDPVQTVGSGERVRATWSVGQNPIYRVRLKKGQRLAADVRSAALSTGGQVLVSLRAPDGAVFGVGDVGDPASGLPQPPVWVESSFTATQDGVWTVVVDPVQATTGSVSLVVRVAGDQVIPGRLGMSTTVTVEKPGGTVILPFDVPQDSQASTVSWQLTGSTFAHARLRLLTPFGGQWDVADLPPGRSAGNLSLPSFFPGTWTLVVDPVDGATGRATVTFRLA